MKILSILFIIILANSIVSLLIIILERKKPEKTVAWIFIILLLPMAGLLLYIILGRNWKQERAKGTYSRDLKVLVRSAENTVNLNEYKRFIDLFAHNSESPVYINNDITIFKDGIEKFKALTEEILKAEHHIHLEYYTVKSDTVGNEIKNALIKKAREGVKVRFIMDRYGSIKLKKTFIKELTAAGVEVVQHAYFLLPIIKYISSHGSYRNHRKLAVIDGKVSFIGGINIGDEYVGKSKYGYWRDTHLLVKGDLVYGLQNVFLDNYIAIKEDSNEIPFFKDNIEEYFPPHNIQTTRVMQLIRSGPDSKFYSALQGVLKMISTAEDHIYITTPYFVPPQGILEALKMAALSGVDVRILFPTQSDVPLMHHASLTYLPELVKYGVKVYLYDSSAFIHAKTVTVDSKFCIAGSTNIDILSFEYNYEASAIIYDREITLKLEELFFQDLERSTVMTEDLTYKTAGHIKAFQTLCRVLSGIL
jgi:cardiolipin synthase A/B